MCAAPLLTLPSFLMGLYYSNMCYILYMFGYMDTNGDRETQTHSS